MMRVAELYKHIATNKTSYLWFLFSGSTAVNLWVFLTHKKIGVVNFSFMTYKLLFEPIIEYYFPFSGPVITILFIVCNFFLLYASLALLLNSRLRLLGWILALLLIASFLPIFDIKRIVI